MLKNSPFPLYDKSINRIIDGYFYQIPSFCKKCFDDSNKKCNMYYETTEFKDGMYSCPYGLSSFVYKGNIFTSLNVKKMQIEKP